MNYLLDTHAFIWMASAPEKLSPRAKNAILDESSQLCMSIASLWEMQIKSNLGKLNLDLSLREMWDEAGSANAIMLLKIEIAHISQLESLPHIHKDPFDRLLICQAQCEELTVLTSDTKIHQYNVPALW